MPVPVMRVRGNPGKPFADIEMPMYCFRCGSRAHLIQDCSCIVLSNMDGPSRELEVGEVVVINGEVYMVMWV